MRIRLRWILLLVLVPTLAAMASIPPNLDDALNAQRNLAARNPGDARVLNDLGNLLALTGRLAEAEETYAQAVALAPDNAAIRYNHALVLQELRQRKQAIKEFKTVLELDPTHAWSYYQLGSLYEDGDKREKAVRNYAKALELDPQLLSPEVNPHIIENRLVTPSLILARWGDSSTAMAPRLYQQPARITDLLVPPLPTPEEEEGSEDEEPTTEEPDEEVTESSPTSVQRPLPRGPRVDDGGIEPPEGDDEEDSDEDEDAEEEEDEEDEGEEEDREAVAGEAVGGGTRTGGEGSQTLTSDDLVPSYAGQVQPRGRAPQGRPLGGSAGTPTRPGDPRVPPGSGSGSGDPGPITPPRGTDPGGGSGTGTGSTGRLDLLLIPEPVDKLAYFVDVDRPAD